MKYKYQGQMCGRTEEGIVKKDTFYQQFILGLKESLHLKKFAANYHYTQI